MSYVATLFQQWDRLKNVKKDVIPLMSNSEEIVKQRRKSSSTLQTLEIEPIPVPQDNFIGVLQCETSKALLYYFKESLGNDTNSYEDLPEDDYNFILAHMTIPKSFQKVDLIGFDANTGGFDDIEFRNIDGAKFDEGISGDYQGYFAVRLKPNPKRIIELIKHIPDEVVDRRGCGSGCGTNCTNYYAKNSKGNLTDMVFAQKNEYNFVSHFYLPIIMETGISLYHRIPGDNKGKNLEKILKKIYGNGRVKHKVGFKTPLKLESDIKNKNNIYIIEEAEYFDI